MAFLLLLHEKMRLKRKVNKLTLKQARFGNRIERMTKNISRVQKMYSNRMTMLEKQAQMMQSQASVFFNNMMGLGTQNQMFSPNNYGSMTSFVVGQMAGMLANGVPKDKDTKYGAIDSDRFQEMLRDFYSTGLAQTKDKEGNFLGDDKFGTDGKFTKDEVTAFRIAMQQAQQNQSNAQMMCNQMSSNYQNNISIWLEAQKEQLEMEQDAALAPLEAEQTDMELENDAVETELAYARERLKALEQACKEEAQEAVPKFGLG